MCCDLADFEENKRCLTANAASARLEFSFRRCWDIHIPASGVVGVDGRRAIDRAVPRFFRHRGWEIGLGGTPEQNSLKDLRCNGARI